MANYTSRLPFCSSIQTPCQPCYLGASTELVSFPYGATTTVIVDIIPHISQLADGSNSTSYATLTQSDVVFASNVSGYDTTIEDGSPITWQTNGVELTFPTTYAHITSFLGAGLSSVTWGSATCAEASDLTTLTLPPPADQTSFYVPIEQVPEGNGSLVSMPPPILDYLESLQPAWSGFAYSQLDSCLQFQADSTLPRSITEGSTATLPCISISASAIPICYGSKNATCTTQTVFTTVPVYPTLFTSAPAPSPTSSPVSSFSTASFLSRRTGDAVFTPAQVPAGILPSTPTESPSPTSAVSVQADQTASSQTVQGGSTPAETNGSVDQDPTGSAVSPDPSPVHTDPIGGYIATGIGASDSGTETTAVDSGTQSPASSSVSFVAFTGDVVRKLPETKLPWLCVTLAAVVLVI